MFRLIILFCVIWCTCAHAQEYTLVNEKFHVSFNDTGMTALVCRQDTFQASFISERDKFGQVVVKFREGDTEWRELSLSNQVITADPESDKFVYSFPFGNSPLLLTQKYRLEEDFLEYTFLIENTADSPVIIGDLAIPIPWHWPYGEEQVDIFEKGFTKHHYISGDGSFLYFAKPSGHPPFMLITTKQGTSLEYFTSERRTGYMVYIHSGLSGNEETRGTWRQDHTILELDGTGGEKSAVSHGFKFHWASSYDEMREILYREHLFDIRVIPGMTLPTDLEARFSLHTQNRIDSIVPEFRDETVIKYLGEPQKDHFIYEVSFRHLGENMLTIHYNGNEKTYLEFFSSEPLETLFKKRASFITKHQQHRDTSKWYNGLYSVYDMKNAVLRGPDNTDGFDGWWGYVLACDDPALCKAPYVAAKNVFLPDEEEIASVEYYLKHFVWGGLQRTDKEKPYPYGIHGVPNWKVSRDPVARAEIETRNLDKMKIWRSYDYPHIFMLYYHMYQIARFYPDLVHYLNAEGYLERAYQTARAYWQYPYEILPWYQIYKIGCYNELVLLKLIEALEKEGYPDRANSLRSEWEKKVKYFIYDDPYPYGSEYRLDRTAFESSYALAKYGTTTEMQPDENLWWDKILEKWYSHPDVSREKAREFMDQQHYAGLAVRGWLETKYFLLGADFTVSSDRHCMSYMACMGGWSILDYGIYFSDKPWDWLQLGYASYLSSWSLMNTGTPGSDYGYWFPGKENDGATGWAFMSSKYGRAWIRKDVPRGAWHYDGEIDLGYGSATRTAMCLLTDDPLLGWIAYGGNLTTGEKTFDITPRDGLRARFGIVTEENRFVMEFERDGFLREKQIHVTRELDQVSCTIENRGTEPHETALKLSVKEPASVKLDGLPLPVTWKKDRWEVNLPMNMKTHKLEINLITK